MAGFKSGIFLMVVLIEQSTQFSISSDMNSESAADTAAAAAVSPSSSNETGCNLKTIGQCFRLRPNDLAACALEHAANNLDCFIASNSTWQLNDYISLRKNDDWQPPSGVEARQDQTLLEKMLAKLSDLIASRSIQFSMPQDGDELPAEGRVKSGFDFAELTNFVGSGVGPGIKQKGRKKKMKHGLMGGGGNFTMIAMFAQLFLGKIAFLAGAALLLSKISLLFSIVNALKKQGGSISGGGGGGGDHVVYGDPGHGYGGHGYQRSIIESPMDWVYTDAPSTTSPNSASHRNFS